MDNVVYGMKNQEVDSTSIFLKSFSMMAVVYLLVLVFIEFPGNASPDSFVQLKQLITNEFTNHHPYWATMYMGMLFKPVYALTQNINLAVFSVAVFQSIFMASVFSYTIMTMGECGFSKKIYKTVTYIYIFLPPHLLYAATLWKDVPEGIFALLFTVCLYRIRHEMQGKHLAWLFLIIAGIGVCLMRGNGAYAFALMIIIYVFAMKKIYINKLLLGTMGMTFIVALFMNGPMINHLNIKPISTTVMVSIPQQQIARVLKDGGTLNEGEWVLLKQIYKADTTQEKICEIYQPFISNNILNIARPVEEVNPFIQENRSELAKAYWDIGCRYPLSYLCGWIDMTRGYWNAGYPYTALIMTVYDNDLGIKRMSVVPSASKVVGKGVINIISRLDAPTALIFCTGFWTWCYMVLIIFNIIVKRDGWLELILPVCIIVSLMLGAPVFNEMRYAYALYTIMPFAFVTALFKSTTETKIYSR